MYTGYRHHFGYHFGVHFGLGTPIWVWVPPCYLIHTNFDPTLNADTMKILHKTLIGLTGKDLKFLQLTGL